MSTCVSRSVPSGEVSSPIVFSGVKRLLQRYRKWRTLNTLHSLPLDIRKDIGWPTADETERLPGYWR